MNSVLKHDKNMTGVRRFASDMERVLHPSVGYVTFCCSHGQIGKG